MNKKQILIGAFMAKNDAKVLRFTLQRLSECCDQIVCLDDGSEDETYEVMQSFPKVVKIIRNKVGQKFDHQLNNRLLYNELTQLKPDWVVFVDPDDLIDKRFLALKDELLNKEGVGQYKFKEITLWGGRTHYRTDRPDAYMRETAYTPLLFRWNDNIKFTIAKESNWKLKLLKSVSNNLFIGNLKKLLPIKKSNFKKASLTKEIFFPTDYMNHTNSRIEGIEGEVIQLELQKIHYHFFDWEYACRKHINYALQAAVRQNRTLEEIPEMVNWAASRLNQDGLELAPVKEEWGVL